ncbi:conserved exported protein of unknown function [Tenacibaculum sp. 190524A02b]|uniref:hypothetical protein n=1 Tax=Tenacibaculum vairaonense TaxID=3137860 RepID=UPI0032B2DF87
MKKITYQTILTCLLLITGVTTFGQQTAHQALDQIIASTNIIDTSTKKAESALKTITIEYFFGQKVNTNGFMAVINNEFETIEEHSDEINQYANLTEDLSDNDLDVSEIKDASTEIEGKGDYTEVNSLALVTAINAGNTSEVSRLIGILSQDFKSILNYSNFIKESAIDLKETPGVFNVRIRLIDRNGNEVPAETLPGYAALNLDTSKYYYAGENRRNIDLFTSLPQGRYRFDAYDGYFDGASSKVVSLSYALVIDNEITVTLSYWSE